MCWMPVKLPKHESSQIYFALKFRLDQCDKVYGGEKQEDSSECLMMLIELINKGSVPHFGSNDNISTGVSLSEIIFSLMLEKYIICNACGLRSPSFGSRSALYITPTCTTSMQELIKKKTMEQKLNKTALIDTKNSSTSYVVMYKLIT